MTPYYDADGVTLYLGDYGEALDWLTADVLITDPPYGIGYTSGRLDALPGIVGDDDTELRDDALRRWGDRRAWACFGSWRRTPPAGARAMLTWDKGAHVGMGDLTIPWKPSTEQIYVGGPGWTGRRDTSVLSVAAPVSWNGQTAAPRRHPHEKPVGLITRLLLKAPPGVVADPFAGSGTTLRAARDVGRRAIGVEVDEAYCAIAVDRLAQGSLWTADA